jgi:uncharacterized membrane protein YGL010W
VRKVDELFLRYGESHRHPANEAIHWICVPLITWSVLAALWVLSPAVAYVGIGLAVAFYAWLSVQIAVGMLALFALMVYPLTILGRIRFGWPPPSSCLRGSANSSVTPSKAGSHRSSRT